VQKFKEPSACTFLLDRQRKLPVGRSDPERGYIELHFIDQTPWQASFRLGVPPFAIDDHSRIAFSQILPNGTAASSIAFLNACLSYYARLGIHIRRLLTDNGHCYRPHAFRRAVLVLGPRHRFTRPYTPRTNGKAERFIQTTLRECAYACVYPTSHHRK
jgi:transposase InsO family protein